MISHGKNGFPGAIIGLSGGMDSALTLAIAVDALGADKVRAVMMPSPSAAVAAPLTRQVEIRDLRVINLMLRSLKDLEIFFRPFLARKRATKKSLLHSSSKISSYTNLHLNNRSLKAAIKNRSLYSSNFLHNLK